ncbi:MAG: 3-oxoacyl-ACP reductase FabG [Bacteroidales bacterium]
MKCALVTGGSRGIGRAISIKLASMGFFVLINYRSNEQEARKTLDEITAHGGEGMLLPFDVSKKSEIEEGLKNWKDKYPDAYIHTLINNAGIREDTMMMWMKDEQWNNVIETNLNSFFYITRSLLNDMLVKKAGRIVNIVSLSGLQGLPGQTNYSAAKAGVIGATKALAKEVARRKVTVNAIAPGFIRTEMTQDLDEKTLSKLIPMQRFGTADEVAELVGFMASDASSYITGQVFSIDGGMN